MNTNTTPPGNIITLTLNEDEIKQVVLLCAKLRIQPNELFHVVTTGTLNDYLTDERLALNLVQDIAKRFPA